MKMVGNFKKFAKLQSLTWVCGGRGEEGSIQKYETIKLIPSDTMIFGHNIILIKEISRLKSK